jgi:hypothetical protein
MNILDEGILCLAAYVDEQLQRAVWLPVPVQPRHFPLPPMVRTTTMAFEFVAVLAWWTLHVRTRICHTAM